MAELDPSGVNQSLKDLENAALNSAQALAKNKEALDRANKSISDMSKPLKELYNEFEEMQKSLQEISSEGAVGISDANKKYAQKVAQHASKTAELTKQIDIEAKIRKQFGESMIKQNQYVQAKMLELWGNIAKQATMEGKLAATGNEVLGFAKDPKAFAAALAGPWGKIFEFIVEIVDQVRKVRGQMMEASAASGNFANSLTEAKRESEELTYAQTQLAMAGLEVRDAVKVYEDLKKTGIAALGVVGRTPEQVTTAVTAIKALAMATGEDTAAVAQRMASFVRNFGISVGNTIKTYTTLYHDAENIAKDGLMTTDQFMQSVMSLGDAFADTGVSITDTSHMLREVGREMNKMGMAKKDMQAIAQGIMGITRAADGWKVMMGKMSGMSGGFAQTLYGVDQRGPGFNLTQAGKKDIGLMVQQGQSMMQQLTGGIADAATQRYIQEQLGKQMGMDEKTLQVFQNLSAGSISQEEAGSQLGALMDAAKEANMSQKDMFDILKNILIGLLAKPIIGIYKILSKGTLGVGGWLGATSDQEISDALKNVKSADIGATIRQGGMLRVHAGEQVVPAAQVAPFQKAQGVNIAFNVNLDENSIRSQFRQMEQKTIELLNRQQKTNYIG